jgi:hypothetical protein
VLRAHVAGWVPVGGTAIADRVSSSVSPPRIETRRLEDLLGYFLDLRVRVRGRPEAIAIVDRCLALIARAQAASAAEMPGLETEVEALRADLEARFGRQARLTVH